MSNNNLKREYKPDESDERPGFVQELLQKARLQRQSAPYGPTVEETTDWGEGTEQYTERKAILRKQAEMLIKRGL